MYCFAFSSEDLEQDHRKQVPTASEAGTPKTDAIPRLGVYLHQISIINWLFDTFELDLQSNTTFARLCTSYKSILIPEWDLSFTTHLGFFRYRTLHQLFFYFRMSLAQERKHCLTTVLQSCILFRDALNKSSLLYSLRKKRSAIFPIRPMKFSLKTLAQKHAKKTVLFNVKPAIS